MNNYKIIYILIALFIVPFSVFVSATNDYSAKEMIIKKVEVFVPQNTENIEKEEKIDLDFSKESNEEENDDFERFLIGLNNEDYQGLWERVELKINDIAVSSLDAILVIKGNYFKKITDCEMSGIISVNNDKMLMEVVDDECKQGINTFANYYELSEDKNMLILKVSYEKDEVKDIYKRVIK